MFQYRYCLAHCRAAFLFAVLLATLLGCTPKRGMITSLDDITTEADRQGDTRFPGIRLIGINGFLPFVDVGTGQFVHKHRRSHTTAVGFSGEWHSYRLVREVPLTEECAGKVVEVRDAILIAQQKAAKYVAARMRYSILLADPQTAPSKEVVTAAATEVTTARAEYDTAYAAAIKAVSCPGIIVFRWTTRESSSGSLGLGDILGLSAAKEEQHSGFVVVGGLRVTTLLVGNDVRDAFKTINANPNDAQHHRVTTFAMHGQHIIYSTEQDLSEVVRLHLNVSAQQLSNLAKTLSELDRIEIELTLARTANLSNTGNIAGMKITRMPVQWNVLDDLSMWVDKEVSIDSKTKAVTTTDKKLPAKPNLPFYVVNMKPEDLIDLIAP